MDFLKKKTFLGILPSKEQKLIVLDFQPSAKQATLIEYFQRRLSPCGFPFPVGRLIFGVWRGQSQYGPRVAGSLPLQERALSAGE